MDIFGFGREFFENMGQNRKFQTETDISVPILLRDPSTNVQKYRFPFCSCKKTEMEVLGRLLIHFSLKFVQKAPYRPGIADSGPGLKKKTFPDRKIREITPGPKFRQVLIQRPEK